jgi:hypothetical protein
MIGDGFIDTHLVLSEVHSSRKDSGDDERRAQQQWVAPENPIVQQLRKELQVLWAEFYAFRHSTSAPNLVSIISIACISCNLLHFTS